MSVSAALTPPPGVKIDYVHSVDRGYQVVDASLISISFAAVLVPVRLAVKVGITRNCGWDDYLLVVSLLFAVAQVTGNVLLVNRYGIGHHSYDVPLQNYEPMLNWIQITTVLYLMAIMFAKLSILLFYNRLFGINKRFRWTVYGAMVFVTGYCVSTALAIIFQCSPPAATWDLILRTKSHCTSLIDIDIAIGGFNIPSDIFILLLPIPMLSKLQMPLPKKLGVMMVMATGIFVCVTAIVREVIIVRTLKNMDEAWTVCDSIIWLTLEVNVGIFCACLPALNSLLRYLTGKNLLSGISLRSVLSLGLLSTKSRGTEDIGSKSRSTEPTADSEKRAYRKLVETPKLSRDGDSATCLHGTKTKTESEFFDQSLPDNPAAIHGSQGNFNGQPSARDHRERDLERGQIWRTNQFELQEFKR